jgi:ubiquinone/menaquinone biosynthesis C-methylase UbiE
VSERRFERQLPSEFGDLRSAWEESAPAVIEWFRAPGHDSYWQYHRDQFLELLPPPGRLTLDVGCGEGRLARHLKALGHSVVALDGAPSMVEAAREADPEIETLLGDAADLPFPDRHADLVVAFMCLQDVDDAAGAIREAARVLEPGGRLCLAVVHPIGSAGRFDGNEPDSPFVIRGSYLAPFRYRDLMTRDGHSVTFESEHRPIEWYFGALEAAGFLVERLRETPVPESALTEERQRRWQRLPLFLHVRAVRP